MIPRQTVAVLFSNGTIAEANVPVGITTREGLSFYFGDKAGKAGEAIQDVTFGYGLGGARSAMHIRRGFGTAAARPSTGNISLVSVEPVAKPGEMSVDQEAKLQLRHALTAETDPVKRGLAKVVAVSEACPA